jgi:hypothetical protein
MAFTYLDFVEERHRIWEKRQAGLPQPWTEDPILASKKFTCVYRVLDPGSQYLWKLWAEGEPEDVLMRCFLYRHTGRIEAWDALELTVGLPTVGSLDQVLEAWRVYRGEGVTKLKNEKPYGERKNRAGGFQKTTYRRSMFTGAYLVFPQTTIPGTDKLESIIDLTRRLFDPRSDTYVVPDFLAAKTQAERFAVLRRNRGVADFMSMQVLTDWGYSPFVDEDREDEFVVPGPGAKRGLDHLGATLAEAVQLIWNSRDCPTIKTPSGQLRRPSMMDGQNCLCEYGKYVRFQQRPLSAKPYVPAHPGPQPDPHMPSHW